MTGLAQAKGDLVFLIDSDLEEEPELREFVQAMRIPVADAAGAPNIADVTDVVYGVQRQRRGRLFERWSGRAFFGSSMSSRTVPFPRTS
jgi:putative glycosyltransferase